MDFLNLPLTFHAKPINQYYPSVLYPFTCSIQNKTIQHQVNRHLYDLASQLVQRQYTEQQTDSFAEMIGTFAIKTNEKQVLSVTSSNYAIFEHAAHGLTLMDSVTIDIQTGHNYSLGELFKEDSNYVSVLSDIVKKQIERRNIPVFETFTSIAPNQSYYIADKCLILYFQLYELTPYYFGFPYFPISLYEIAPLLRDDIFIQRLLQNN